MNERIRELAKEARYDSKNEKHYLERIHNREITLDEYQEIYDKKFAELIVRECARVARATPCPDFHESLKQQLGHTWDMASVEAGKQIVKHFGVRE